MRTIGIRDLVLGLGTVAAARSPEPADAAPLDGRRAGQRLVGHRGQPGQRPMIGDADALGAAALTFDEFGMWLHLGGSYWQRASVDAVIVVGAVLGLCSYMRSIERFESHHKVASAVLLFALAGFAWVLYSAGLHLGDVVGPKLLELEASSSP